MRAIARLLMATVLVSGLAVPARSGPTPGGFASDNIEWVGHVPFDAVTATGARIVGKYMYVTSWRNFSIYDVSDPAAPELVSTRPFGFEFENEDVSTDGKIMLFSESLPRNILHIWDVEDKSNPVPLADLPNAGDHTMTCILRCEWAYGSDGTIVDLRNPAKPRIAASRTDKNNWHAQTGIMDDAHDVEEFKNGFLITSTHSEPFQLLDVRDPMQPKVLARGAHPRPGGWIFHSGAWPNQGRDNFVLMEGEGTNGPFLTYDARKWKKTRTFNLIDTYTVPSGNYANGRSRDSGESSHWFSAHPRFKNGGLVVAGWYSHGTRLLKVLPNGKIRESGYFLPYGANTFSAYWASDRIIYAVDLNRGIDILRYTGKL